MAVFFDPHDDKAQPHTRAVTGGHARWIGASGNRYSAEIYPLGLALPPVSGVFIMARQRGPLAQSWTALFVGTDADMATAVREVRRHSHLWDFAVELGMTAIHLVTTAAGAAERHDIARDLIRSLLPSLNRETAAMPRAGGANLGVTT